MRESKKRKMSMAQMQTGKRSPVPREDPRYLQGISLQRKL